MNSAYETVEEIKGISIDDPEYDDKLACIIKRFGHSQKLDAYHNVFLHVKYLPRKPKAFKKNVKYYFSDYLPAKILTHEKFSKASYRKQIYGLFNWKK